MRVPKITAEQLTTLQLPPFLRVEDAARILDISRSTAYEQAGRWLATHGQEGLPVVRLGRCLRVPRPALVKMLGTAPDS